MDWPTKSCHIQVNWEFHPKAIWAESWHHGDSWENSTFRTCNQTGMSIQDLTVRHSHGTCCSKAHCGKASVILVNIRKFEGNALQHCNHQINQPARSSKIPLNSFTQNAHCKAVKETPWEESPNHHPNLPIFAPCFAAFRRPAASSASWISYTQVQNVANCSQASTNYKVKLLSIGGGTMNHGKNHEDTKILEAARCLDFSELQEINGYHLIHLRSLYISQLHPSSPMFSSKIFFLNRNLICQDFFPLTFLCDISFQRSKLLSSPTKS